MNCDSRDSAAVVADGQKPQGYGNPEAQWIQPEQGWVVPMVVRKVAVLGTCDWQLKWVLWAQGLVIDNGSAWGWGKLLTDS